MLFDYSREPHSDIAFVDMKSFYASCECVRLGLNPLTTSLCVMSRSDNSAGLILASSPVFKQVFGKKNVSRSYDLPFDLKTILGQADSDCASTDECLHSGQYGDSKSFSGICSTR